MILFWFVCIVFLFQFWCYIHNSKFIFRHIRHLYKYRFIEFIISCYELIRNRHGWQNQQRRKLAALRAKETKMISKTSKKAAPGGEILPGAALFYGVLSPYWSVYWSVQKSNFEANSLQINIKKSSWFLVKSGTFWWRLLDSNQWPPACEEMLWIWCRYPITVECLCS